MSKGVSYEGKPTKGRQPHRILSTDKDGGQTEWVTKEMSNAHPGFLFLLPFLFMTFERGIIISIFTLENYYLSVRKWNHLIKYFPLDLTVIDD